MVMCLNSCLHWTNEAMPTPTPEGERDLEPIEVESVVVVEGLVFQ